MSRAQREKGKRGEREAAAVLRAWGLEARRGRQYAGHEDAPDVVCGLFGFHVEVKRRRCSADAWLREAREDAPGKRPLVLHRGDRGEWLCTVCAADVPALVEAMK